MFLAYFLLNEAFKTAQIHTQAHTPETEIIEIERAIYKFPQDKCNVLIQHVFLFF